eukprot:GGOE01054627.1.p1 GENE.GGOE01054627.1~~GGOE01054627.1.p1  ORF type:complete len:394 (+),score=118.66 GGOE01054627.1:41-1183(+)
MTEGSKKPADTPFKQQRLPAWQPILSPPWVICCFFLVAVVFIPIGALVIVASGQVVEYEVQYAGDASSCKNPAAGVRCEEWVSITLKADMEPPVYMYYKLENFYQNHRRYAKSRSDTQLSGSSVDYGSISDCEPVRYPGELQSTGSAGSGISNLYAPCGLIAWSMFNDSFTVFVTDPSSNCSSDTTSCGSPVCVGYLKAFPMPSDVPTNPACTDNGVAWDSDVDRKFKAPYSSGDTTYIQSYVGSPTFYYSEGPSNTSALIEGHAMPVQTDQDFMVWMRIASLPTFRKLYRIFPSYSGFKKGSVVWIRIYNRFPVSSFGGKKYIILSTTSWIGGKNYFLGIAYVVVGCLCFLLGVIFAIKHVLFGRNTGSEAFSGSHKPN